MYLIDFSNRKFYIYSRVEVGRVLFNENLIKYTDECSIAYFNTFPVKHRNQKVSMKFSRHIGTYWNRWLNCGTFSSFFFGYYVLQGRCIIYTWDWYAYWLEWIYGYSRITSATALFCFEYSLPHFLLNSLQFTALCLVQAQAAYCERFCFIKINRKICLKKCFVDVDDCKAFFIEYGLTWYHAWMARKWSDLITCLNLVRIYMYIAMLFSSNVH